ncbi:MAG: tryptophan synthase subunit alpha, partial [Imperialibacter sp.]
MSEIIEANRIDTLFTEKADHILSMYFTAGYPGLHDTRKIMKALQDGGADVIEVGIPFSDP